MHSLPFPKIERLGPYELVRRLATGGMAEVYEAKRVGPHGFSKRFALKRILPQLSSDVRLVQMFCDEARVHAALSHPNLVEVVDFGEAEGAMYLVMEFVDGLTCADLLSALAARQRKAELAPALFIAREVLAGLSHAHEHRDESGNPLGLVHRDVAPNNILVAHAGRVLLADFGIVRCAVSDLRTTPGEIKGKVGYVSPEQAVGAEVDARSDVFSLAVVLSELVLGKPLFPGRTELEILQNLHAGQLGALASSELPADLRVILRRALAQRPRDRHGSARELSLDLDRLARAHGASMSRDDFAAWLSDLGLVALKSGVTLRRDALSEDDSGPRSARPPAWAATEGALRASPGSLADSVRQFAGGGERPSAPPARGLALLELVASPPPSPIAASLPWYRIRRPGGTIVGPLSLARLLEMIATARAGGDTEVSRSGGPFLSVSAVNELTRLASRPLFRFYEPIALFATERHAVQGSSLAWHLFRYVAMRKTGLVCVRNGREQLRVYFVSGVPTASASTDPEDLLGRCAVRAGLVTTEVLERALETGHRQGKSLGQALLDLRLFEPSDLLACIAEQRARRVAALLRFREGDLCFVEGAASGEEALALPPSATAFIARAVRAAYPREELLSLLSGLPLAPLVTRPILHLQQSALGLDAEEAQAFDRVASGVPPHLVLSQARKHGIDAESAALRALFLGLSSGAFSLG